MLDGALSSNLRNLLCSPSGPASASLLAGAATSFHRGSFHVKPDAGVGKGMVFLGRFLKCSPSSCSVLVDNTGGLATRASNFLNFSSKPDPPARKIGRCCVYGNRHQDTATSAAERQCPLSAYVHAVNLVLKRARGKKVLCAAQFTQKASLLTLTILS